MSTPKPYAIILDDHPLVGRGMAQYLQSVYPYLNTHVVSTWGEALECIPALGCPRVVVADVWLADGNSLPLLAQWHTLHPDVPWLAISADDDPATAQRVRAAGAQAFVHKRASPEVFGQAITSALEGRPWFAAMQPPQVGDPAKREWQVTPAELGLTARQGDILVLLLRGQSNKRIALTLDITESTVKEHVTAILERLGVRSRVEAIMALQGRKLVSADMP